MPPAKNRQKILRARNLAVLVALVVLVLLLYALTILRIEG